MSSESPLRMSSTSLMAACILCGILVASLLIPKLAPTASSYLHFGGDSKVAAANQSLQKTLSEFQTVQQDEVDQTPAAALAETPRQSGPLATVAEILRRSPRRVVASAHQNSVETTFLERNAAQTEPPGQQVPQFYAPVTVHPVTVNVDNSGLMQELLRVQQRLDVLSNASNAREQTPSSNDNTVPDKPAAPVPYRVHSAGDHKADESRPASKPETFALVPYRVHSAEDQPHSTPKVEPEESAVKSAAKTPETAPVAELQPSSPQEEVTFTVSSPSPDETPAPTAIPVAEPAPPTVDSPATEPVPQPAAEIAYELIQPKPLPELLCPEIDSEPGEDSPPIAFPDERFTVPEPVHPAGPVPPIPPRSFFSTISETKEPEAGQTPPPTTERPQLPEFDWSLVPNQQGAKRTTDPPFMNGRTGRLPAAADRFSPASLAGGIQRASFTVPQVPVADSPAAICRNCESVRRSEMSESPSAKLHASTSKPKSSPFRVTAAGVMDKVGKLFQH